MDKQTGSAGQAGNREPDFTAGAAGATCRHARLTRINDATSLDVTLRCNFCGEVRKVDSQGLSYRGEREAWATAGTVKSAMGRGCPTCEYNPHGTSECVACVLDGGYKHWRPAPGAVLRPVRVEATAPVPAVPVPAAPETCGGCRFWKRKHFEDGTPAECGGCRRYPPAVHLWGNGSGSLSTGHTTPETGASDWCGEWRARS